MLFFSFVYLCNVCSLRGFFFLTIFHHCFPLLAMFSPFLLCTIFVSLSWISCDLRSGRVVMKLSLLLCLFSRRGLG